MADRSHLYKRVPQAYRDDPSRFVLNPLDRTCLDRWLAGETQASIAAALGVSTCRCCQRIDRAVRHIKQQIARAVRRQREGIPRVLTAAEEARWWRNWLRTTRCMGKFSKAEDGMLLYRWRSPAGKLSKHIASYDLVTFAREVSLWEAIVKGIASG